MKRLLAVFSFTFLVPLLASAQDYRADEEDYAKYDFSHPIKYEVRLGIAGVPFYEHNMLDVCSDRRLQSSGTCDMNWLYRDCLGAGYTTGSMSAEFVFIIKHWLNVSLTVADCCAWRSVYDSVTGDFKDPVVCNTFTILPQVRFTYLSKRYVKLYSSVGAGVRGGVYDHEWKSGVALQLCPIGIMTGRRVYGFTELGFGTLYSGLNAGIGFRF